MPSREQGTGVRSSASREQGTEVRSSSRDQRAQGCPSDAGGQVWSAAVRYNGRPFAGFARQPGQLTVQGELERALATVLRHPVETVCAGRTDAGVHALGQVVSFPMTREDAARVTEESLRRSLNALTHDGIAVPCVQRRESGFSARFSAQEREYRYFLCEDAVPPLVLRDFCWQVGKPLDVDAMREAAALLVGEHDFKSFCVAASAVGKSTVREVRSITLAREQWFGSNMLCITVVGNAFLHSMVRTIVGSLVLVGKHHREPEWMGRVLAARDRSAAGECAPAQGLIFWQVRY